MMKHCNSCDSTKPISAFNKRGGTRNGYQHKCKACAYAYQKNNRKPAKPEQSRSYRLKAKYGMALEDFNTLLESQNGACAVCSTVFASDSDACVDHDHACCPGEFTCGKCVRGLLCSDCNLALGKVKDNVETLMGLAAYVISRQDVLSGVAS